MTPEALLYEFLASPTIAHLLFGALGGLVYVAVYRMHGDKVTMTDIILRPFLGAVAGAILAGPALKEHVAFSFDCNLAGFVLGYFGVDVLKGMMTFARTKFPALPGGSQPPEGPK